MSTVAPSSPLEEMSPTRNIKGILKNCSSSDLNATVSGFPSARQFSLPSPTQSLASLSTAADKWRSIIVLTSDLFLPFFHYFNNFFFITSNLFLKTLHFYRYTVSSLAAMFSEPSTGAKRKLNLNDLDMSPQEMKESINLTDNIQSLYDQEWEDQEMEKSIDFTSIK